MTEYSTASKMEAEALRLVRQVRARRHLLAIALAAYCGGISTARPTDPPVEISSDVVVAHVGTTVIRLSEVDAAAGKEVADLEARLYTARKLALENIIDGLLLRMEAGFRHVTEDDLIDRTAALVPAPSSIDVERAWLDSYDALSPMGDVRGRLRARMDIQDHGRSEAVDEFLGELRKRAAVEILLAKPQYRLRVRDSGLRLGVDHPTLQLTVFMDYDCPYCRNFQSQLKAALSDPVLAPKLGVVIKQFPLPIHNTAFQASVAAVCAAQQGMFREAHERLFASSSHTTAGILAALDSLPMNQAALKACMAGDRAKTEVLRDVAEAKANGVEGTPSVFLEGVALDAHENLADALLAKVAAPNKGDVGNPSSHEGEK